jgi:hypothetical protein
MKIINLILSTILAGSVIACSQIDPIPRDQVAANLPPIVKIEKQASHLNYYIQALGSMGKMSDENLARLKAHYDIYYVYWTAAIFLLATGNMESYLAHVKMAERELDAMERILKDKFTELGEAETEREGRFSGLGL